MKMMAGRILWASEKMAETCFCVSPNHLLCTLLARMLMNEAPDSLARACDPQDHPELGLVHALTVRILHIVIAVLSRSAIAVSLFGLLLMNLLSFSVAIKGHTRIY